MARKITILLLLALFTGPAGYAQVVISPDSLLRLLSATDWGEATPADTSLVLRLDASGSFEEDAGENFTRPSRYLLGRWTFDTATHVLSLGVDGLLASNLPARYREGRDYYLRYDLEFVSPTAIELTDRKTGRKRHFVAVTRAADYQDAGDRRKPTTTAEPKEPVFTLPKLPGGGTPAPPPFGGDWRI